MTAVRDKNQQMCGIQDPPDMQNISCDHKKT